MANYSVKVKPSALKQLAAIRDHAARHRVEEKIRALANVPRPVGYKKLTDEEGIYRVRQGDYRILYKIEDRILRVFVVRDAHRSDAYR